MCLILEILQYSMNNLIHKIMGGITASYQPQVLYSLILSPIINDIELFLKLDPGPLLAKQEDVLILNLMKSQSHDR